MTATNPRVNPLFVPSLSTPATVAPSRTACQRATKLGGYGGMAVTAWLVTAVATGYGVAAADTAGASSESPASSSSAGPTSSKASSGESATGSAATSTAETAASSTATPGVDSTSTNTGSTSAGGGTSATDTTKPSGATSSTAQVAPGVTISSSGGAHTSATESEASTAPTSTSTESPDDTSGVEAQPESSQTAASGGTPESSQASTPPAVSAPVTSAAETQQPTSTRAETESNSTHPITVDAATATPSATKTSSTTASPTPATPIAVVDPVETAMESSATVTASSVVPTANALVAGAASSAPATQAATALVAPKAQVAAPTVGLVGFLNGIVTNILNPFLAPAPSTPEPVTPVVWALLGWVRRNLFNQSPTINPTETVQTGQTVTGNIGATDPERDALTYTVTQAPHYGTLTIDQATGNYTYTPDDIDYDAAQTDSFTVSVTDGKFNLLGLYRPHSDTESVGLEVLNPTVQRVILNMPDGVTNPANPRYSEDGKSIYFAGTPTAGGRTEIYQISVDGTHTECVTCGVSTNETGNLAKPVPVDDGSGRVLVLVNVDGQSPRYSILEDGVNGRQLVPVTTPPGGGFAIDPQREMRVSPDGQHVLFTRIVLGPNNLVQALPIVGTLNRTATGYEVVDARVVYPTGEGKQWTPDGKGVVILGGAYEAGNVDDIEVDLATGTVNRVTANLDYDEDMDYSPNEQWIAIGSTRGLDALTPMTRIVRPNFLPAYVSAPVYLEYALPINVSNQEWAVAVDDELKRENGIPLFDTGDGWAARSMPSWNPTGDAVTFWESGVADPTQSRLVIANLKYTTSVGPVAADRTTPESDVGSATEHVRCHHDAATGGRNVRRRRRRHRRGQRGPGPGGRDSHDPHRHLRQLRQRGRNDPQRHRISRLQRRPDRRALPRRYHRHGRAHRLPAGRRDGQCIPAIVDRLHHL